MRTNRVLVLAIFLVSILAGCGGDRGVTVNIYVGDQATQTTVAEPTQPASAPEPIATLTEAAPPAEPTAPAEPVQPTMPPEPPPTEAPAALPPEPTTAPPPEPPPDDQYTFDPDLWEGSLATLGSFRQHVTLDFTADGTSVSSQAIYKGEVTTDPTALHSILAVQGPAVSQLPSDQVEVIWIGDQAWVKVGRRPWVQAPVSALESEYAGQVVGVGDLLPFIQQARRVLPDETVNGIACKHYAYDVSNLQTDSGMTSALGDIWVAVDGGYVVRLTLNGQGTYYGTYTSSGALNLVYDLFDVNASISIKPPR